MLHEKAYWKKKKKKRKKKSYTYFVEFYQVWFFQGLQVCNFNIIWEGKKKELEYNQ